MPKFQPGQSGNPRGRPPKGRALTEILRKAGSRTLEVGGKRVARQRIIADLVWQLAATGQAEFPDGTKITVLDVADWVAAVKWLYTHLDGPPRAELDVASGGQPILISSIEAVVPESSGDDE